MAPNVLPSQEFGFCASGMLYSRFNILIQSSPFLDSHMNPGLGTVQSELILFWWYSVFRV